MTIPVILSTGSLFTFDVELVMKLAAHAGFDGVELMVDQRRETHDPVHLWRLMRRYRLPIMAVHSPFTSMALADWPLNPVDSIKHSVKLAEVLGAQTVVVHPPGRWLRLRGVVVHPQREWKVTVPLPLLPPGELGQWLTTKLSDYQAGTRVKIAVENMPCRQLGPLKLNAHHFTSVPALQQFKHLTLDTTHTGTRNWDLLGVYNQLGPNVVHIHLSNFNGKEHQLPENGWLPLARLLQQLRENNYHGLVSLELGPLSLEAHRPTQLEQNLQSSLYFCQKYLIN